MRLFFNMFFLNISYTWSMFDMISIGNNDGWIYSLVILVVLFFGGRKKFRPTIVLPKENISGGILFFRYLLYVSIALCMLLIPLDLQVYSGEKEVRTVMPRVQLVVDVSLSMSADDVQPSRFIAAKELIQTIVNNFDDVEISLIAFSGIPVVQIPFTSDTEAFSSHVEQMELADFPPTIDFLGTAIGDALLLSVDALDQYDYTDGTSIILITDGDSSVGLDPLDIVDTIIDKGISVSAFALGKEEFSLGTDTQGREVIAYIDIPTLQKITDRTGGSFTHVLQEKNIQDHVDKVFTNIQQQETIRAIRKIYAMNTYIILLLLVLLALYLIRKVYIYMRIYRYIEEQ